MADFTLPELGENITAGDVLNVLVKVGDTVARDQAVLELETDKATIEVPSSISGKVTAIKVKAGDKVKVGQAILSLEDNGVPASAAPPKAAPVAAPPQPPPPAEAPAPVERIRPAVEKDNVVDISRGTRPAPAPPPIAQAASAGSSAPAAPSVRRMARELGVNIDEVAGTGDDGRISIDDVKAHAKRLITTAASGGAATRPAGEPLPDFSRWGAIERQPMRGIRKKTAEHLGASWATIPLVTQYRFGRYHRLRGNQKAACGAGGQDRAAAYGDDAGGEDRRGRAEAVSAIQRVDRHGRRRDHREEVRPCGCGR